MASDRALEGSAEGLQGGALVASDPEVKLPNQGGQQQSRQDGQGGDHPDPEQQRHGLLPLASPGLL